MLLPARFVIKREAGAETGGNTPQLQGTVSAHSVAFIDLITLNLHTRTESSQDLVPL